LKKYDLEQNILSENNYFSHSKCGFDISEDGSIAFGVKYCQNLNTIIREDLDNKNTIEFEKKHSAIIRGVTLDSNRNLIVSGGDDGSVIIHDSTNGKCQNEFHDLQIGSIQFIKIEGNFGIIFGESGLFKFIHLNHFKMISLDIQFQMNLDIICVPIILHEKEAKNSNHRQIFLCHKSGIISIIKFDQIQVQNNLNAESIQKSNQLLKTYSLKNSFQM
jgi:WD40 repeat protein